MTRLRAGWHACQDCPECDGDATTECSWSAWVGEGGHQDAACRHTSAPARPEEST